MVQSAIPAISNLRWVGPNFGVERAVGESQFSFVIPSFSVSPSGNKIVTACASSLQDALYSSGWCVAASKRSTINELSDVVQAIGLVLGEIAPGRGGALIERIVPHERECAYEGSLSSQYGLESIPLHTDTAHWSVPCKYVVIACAETGPKSTPTILFDSAQAVLTMREANACKSAVFLIRNGKRSFYGSIAQRGRPFVRLDSGCMTPQGADGDVAINALNANRQSAAIHRHNWTVGDVMIINNWRVLHGRGNAERTEQGRILLRAMVT